MREHLWSTVVFTALLLGGARAASAGPIAPNVRPISTGSSWGGEPSLSSILGTLFNGDASPETTSLSYDVIGNESTAGLWSAVGGTTAVTMQFEYSAMAGVNEVGLWSVDNTHGPDDTHGPLAKLKLFDGTATGRNDGGSASTSVQFGPGGITVSGPCGFVNCQTDASNTRLDPSAFGFYINTPLGEFYTMDAYNHGKEAHALSFTDGAGLWAVAFEDQPLGFSDHDYNDQVLTFRSSVLADPSDPPTPTPEPATCILLGTGLAGAMGRRWRRMARAA